MRKITLVSVLMVAVLSYISMPALANGEVYYSVKTGDTLYGIGKKFGTSYRAIMRENSLDSSRISIGQNLRIPTDQFEVHTVKQGDTLYGLSRKYGTRVDAIKRASNLASAVIRPGMKLVIPGEDQVAEKQAVKPVFGGHLSITKEDIYLLAKLIHAEARGESLAGQVAVGAVIMNRLTSGDFPASVKDIIFQKTKGVYQFTPVQDGQINLEPDRNAFLAAERAIKGDDPTEGALFFYNPETSSDQWIRTLAVKRVIGNHVFAK